MNKKFLILVIVLIVVLIGSFAFLKRSINQKAATPKKKASQEVPIRAGLVTVFRESQVPVMIAIEKGIFKKYNLDVKTVMIEKGLADLMVSGNADIGMAEPYTFLAAVVKGAKLTNVGAVSKVPPFILLTRKPADQIKVVAVRSQWTQLMASTLLRDAGIDLKNITFQNTGTLDAQVAALTSSKVDAISILSSQWDLYKTRANLTDTQYTVLIDTSNKSNFSTNSIIVSNELLEKNKQAVINYARALLEANGWLSVNKQEGAQLLKKTITGLSDDDAAKLVDEYVALSLNVKFAPNTDDTKDFLDLLSGDIPQAKDFPPEKFVSSAVSDALK